MTKTTYCTLFRLGYWCSLDAKCETSTSAEFPGITDHLVHFRLLDKYGDRLSMGFSIISEADTGEIWDEDGETFPDLDTAVRAHAASLLQVSAMPGRWMDTPPQHDTFQDTVAGAFDTSGEPT